jgi:hypothetical protein
MLMLLCWLAAVVHTAVPAPAVQGQFRLLCSPSTPATTPAPEQKHPEETIVTMRFACSHLRSQTRIVGVGCGKALLCCRCRLGLHGCIIERLAQQLL